MSAEKKRIVSGSKISVLVVDDHFVVRMGLTASINAEKDMKLIAEARDGEEGIAAYRRLQPDVVLMDLKLPGMSGVEATAAIRTEFPQARIIALTTAYGEEDIRSAILAGATGYLIKSAERSELLETIRAVHSGESCFGPEVAARLARGLARPVLTSREREILELIVHGQSNKEIGGALGISEITVKRHVGQLLSKLDVNDRTQAATKAIQQGLVHLE
jgi:two-component system, NarL family, response regulator